MSKNKEQIKSEVIKTLNEEIDNLRKRARGLTGELLLDFEARIDQTEFLKTKIAMLLDFD